MSPSHVTRFSVTKPRRRTIRQVTAAMLVTTALLGTGLAAATAAEAAPCRIEQCPEPPAPAPRPAPTHTTVYGLSPAYGWAR